MKIISLILFTLIFTCSFSQTETLYSTAFSYRDKDGDWQTPTETKIKITIDSDQVNIFSKQHQTLYITSVTTTEDGSTKYECLDENSLLQYVYRKEENNIIHITVDYLDYFISYNCNK